MLDRQPWRRLRYKHIVNALGEAWENKSTTTTTTTIIIQLLPSLKEVQSKDEQMATNKLSW